MHRLLLVIAASCVLGCGPSTTREPVEPAPEPGAPPRAANTGDAPEISRSLGEKGGIVVFWPRVIPRTDDARMRELAGKLQQRLTEVANKEGLKVDVRPEPERVCPQDGCVAMTLGAMLLHREGGCTALGLVSGTGQAPIKIVPWAGVVTLKKDSVPFRDPPESEVTVNDAVPCDQLLSKLVEHDPDLATAVHDAAASP